MGILGRRPRAGVAWVLVLACAAPALALETDQYYAWGREIADSAPALNAKIELELGQLLARLNSRRSWRTLTCESVSRRLARELRMLVFHPIEMWASNTSLIERVPASGEEELAYRAASLLGNARVFDAGTWLPPAPTLEVNGIRIGTDKLAHFFSGGGSYQRYVMRARKWGMSDAEAQTKVIDHGIFSEQTYLGKTSSGVFSRADLEANYQGMRFFLGMCDGDDPLLERSDSGWQLTRPIDFADYVTIEWDESFNNGGYSRYRWKRVLPILRQYCDRLGDPWVVAHRARYAQQDADTRTELRIRELVAAGRLDDAAPFTLERACADPAPD